MDTGMFPIMTRHLQDSEWKQSQQWQSQMWKTEATTRTYINTTFWETHSNPLDLTPIQHGWLISS